MGIRWRCDRRWLESPTELRVTFPRPGAGVGFAKLVCFPVVFVLPTAGGGFLVDVLVIIRGNGTAQACLDVVSRWSSTMDTQQRTE